MAKTEKGKRLVGGSAAERGLGFQARVSAIVMANLLAERPVGWLEGVLADIPKCLDAETGGPGDDIAFVCTNDQIVEVQAKRGLATGQSLWDALLALANGVAKGRIQAGVLAVCPNSSGTIKAQLAEDIVRIGTGRTDGLRDLGVHFLELLKSNSIDPTEACKSVRIVTVAAIDGNRDSEGLAAERLAPLVVDPALAWASLVAYGRRLVEIRGGATSASIAKELALRGVELRKGPIETSFQLRSELSTWMRATYSKLTILGVSSPIGLKESWIPLQATVVEAADSSDQELDSAIRRYHDYGSRRRRSDREIDAHTIGRFIRKAVVVGGPGIGKSTLLKRLALDYSSDGYLVLLARLPQVVALTRSSGRRFEACLVEAALSSSGLHPGPVALEDAVLLCDGLDECGSLQAIATEALHAFAAGHPDSRVIVATRPIGYQSTLLGSWRHYELQALNETKAEGALETVLDSIPFPDDQRRATSRALAKEQLKARHVRGVAARSPLMLTLIAALAAKGIEPSTDRTSLYRQLFKLIEDHPPPRMTATPPAVAERSRLLELLGWSLLAHGYEPADDAVSRCARWWQDETGLGQMASHGKVEECIRYWEALGVVERVQTSTQEALTFVHKTFGEFAAARYIATCAVSEQRALVSQAIRTPSWRETLSFASHLGLANVILEVWTELATAGDSTAAFGLEDASELIVQSGLPVAPTAVGAFANSCWRVCANAFSKTRYAAGDALCLIAETNWPLMRDQTLANLEATDAWVSIVAWGALCASDDAGVPYEQLLQRLLSAKDNWPKESHLRGFDLSSSGSAVKTKFLVGAARRIVSNSANAEGLDVLRKVLEKDDWLSVNDYVELSKVLEGTGVPLPSRTSFRAHFDKFLADIAPWNGQMSCLLETIDDSSVAPEASDPSDGFLELGALLTASRFWELDASTLSTFCATSEVYVERRYVLHAIARAAGIDVRRLAAQARRYKNRPVEAERSQRMWLYDLDSVDADADFDRLSIDAAKLPLLESIIMQGEKYFALSGAQLLHGLRHSAGYEDSVGRLVANGKGFALYLAALLGRDLPADRIQAMLVERLSRGPLGDGCRHLYRELKQPFTNAHELIVLRGLAGNLPRVATASVELAKAMPRTPEFIEKLCVEFDAWRGKEQPYPLKTGTVPLSPRDELAIVLVEAYHDDAPFLIATAKDSRPEVRKQATAPLLAMMLRDEKVRVEVVAELSAGEITAPLLRQAIAGHIFTVATSHEVLPLLKSSSASLRYSAIPILDLRFLPVDVIRHEATRLLADPELDIREAASTALAAIDASDAQG